MALRLATVYVRPAKGDTDIIGTGIARREPDGMLQAVLSVTVLRSDLDSVRVPRDAEALSTARAVGDRNRRDIVSAPRPDSDGDELVAHPVCTDLQVRDSPGALVHARCLVVGDGGEVHVDDPDTVPAGVSGTCTTG